MLVLHFFLVLFFYIEINITIFNSSVRLYKTRSKARHRVINYKIKHKNNIKFNGVILTRNRVVASISRFFLRFVPK
jgi:hypothetical protein